jgi:hypothetical protein
MTRVWVDAGAWLERHERQHESREHDDDLLALMSERPVPPQRSRGNPPGSTGPAPKLSRAQAERAAKVAAEVGTTVTAQRFGVSTSLLRSTWHRYGIDFPGRRGPRPPGA